MSHHDTQEKNEVVGQYVSESEHRARNKKSLPIAPKEGLIGDELKDESKKGRGLIFMALPLEVEKKHLELAAKRKITPTEDCLLRAIRLGTMGAQNGRHQICSAAEFYLDDLAETIGVLKNKIYVNLKSLQEKDLIIRLPTRSKGKEFIGLNPIKFGGQLLIDKQHQLEEKRLKLVGPHKGPEVLSQEESSPNMGPNIIDNRTSMIRQ